MMGEGTCHKVETYIAHNKQKRKHPEQKRPLEKEVFYCYLTHFHSS